MSLQALRPLNAFRPFTTPVGGAAAVDPLAALIAALFGNDEEGGLWLPGPTTCFTDTAGTTAAGVGDTVARINDSSGNGNHAIQATAGSRPALGRTVEEGRRNLFLATEALNASPWSLTRATITANAPDPNGGTTAFALNQATGQTSAGGVFIANPVSLDVQFTVSAYVKANGKNFCRILPSGGVNNAVWFNLTTGSVAKQGTGSVGAIESVGDGWYRCSVTRTETGAMGNFVVYPSDTDNSDVVTDSGGIYIWRPQIELGSTPTDYQRVGASALDVTEAGKKELYYLKDDGIDDSLVATFAASLGADCTIVRADQTGVVTQTAQTVGTTYDIMAATDIYGLCIVDRALTAGELASLQAYMTGRRP